MATSRRTFITSLAAAGVVGFSKEPPMPFPELEASGEPGDLGLAQGRAFPEKIRANLSFYVRWLSDSGQTTPERLRELARGFRPVLEEHFPDMLEEIDGVARGARLPLEDILLINARTDLLALVKAELAETRAAACTALALEGKVDGRTVLALCQNWDWDPLLADAPIVLRLRPSRGPAFVSLVEAGMIGKIGFNEHRLGVCLNFLSHRTDAPPDTFGVPIHCLLRAVLDCSTIDEATATVEAAPRCASANFLLAQHTGEGPRIRDLEISPGAVARLESESGELVHTNHFLDPELARGCTSGFGPSTMKRYARARALAAKLRSRKVDPVPRAERILESRRDLPYPISRHHNPDPSSSTLAGIIMDLTRNRFILTNGAPHRSRWVDCRGV
jgi:isopenicillin-N N-acyltransferase-like protein